MDQDKLQCLRDCLKHWQWMEATGSDNKVDYFYTADQLYNAIPKEKCFACQYVIDTTGEFDCRICPLNGYAWEFEDVRFPCTQDINSTYLFWSISVDSGETTEDLKLLAGDMVKHIRKAIADLVNASE